MKSSIGRTFMFGAVALAFWVVICFVGMTSASNSIKNFKSKEKDEQHYLNQPHTTTSTKISGPDVTIKVTQSLPTETLAHATSVPDKILLQHAKLLRLQQEFEAKSTAHHTFVKESINVVKLMSADLAGEIIGDVRADAPAHRKDPDAMRKELMSMMFSASTRQATSIANTVQYIKDTSATWENEMSYIKVSELMRIYIPVLEAVKNINDVNKMWRQESDRINKKFSDILVETEDIAEGCLLDFEDKGLGALCPEGKPACEVLKVCQKLAGEIKAACAESHGKQCLNAEVIFD